ncbi:MAG: hypothetical protein V4569_01480 [Pseudomonadota bacterium]
MTPASVVFVGGLIAAALDIVFACSYWALRRDVPVQRVLQSVAAGLRGPASFSGGIATAALGLLLHVLIALGMAYAYYFAAKAWPALWHQPWLGGLGYGLLLYAVMTFVVVPLSAAAPSSTRDPLWTALSVAAHVLLVGWPIAFAARRALA